MADTWVLDISNYQGSFDVARAAAEGYSAILCKATEGTTFRDSTFDRNLPLIMAAELIPGAYHFLRSSDGAAQARAFHARVAANGGPAGWLIALDNEADATWDVTCAWVTEWNRLTDHHPFLMYSGAWWWGPRGWSGAQLTPYLWHSHYVNGSDLGSALYAKVPGSWWSPGYGGWGTATLLQFTSQALVAGQKIDVSAYRGSVDELRQLTRPGPPPAPDPGPEQEQVPVGPSWPGRHLRQPPIMRGEDVRTWQDQMRQRGWRLAVDGAYGPASATVCLRFQAEKHLQVDGVVGPVTWSAAWTMPVT